MFLSSSPKRFGKPITLPTPSVNTIPVRTTPPTNVAPVQLPVTVKVVKMRNEEKTTK